MALSKYISSAIFAIAASALLAVNVNSNVIEIIGHADAWDLGRIVIGLSCANALLSLFLCRISRASWLTGLAAVVVIAGCTVTSLRLTADRIGSVRQDTAQPVIDANLRIERLERRIASLRKTIADETPIESTECARYNPRKHRAEDWPHCLGARGKIAAANTELPRLVAERTALGEKRDPTKVTEQLLGWVIGPQASAADAVTRPIIESALLEIGTALLFAVAGLFWPQSTAPARVDHVTYGEMIDITPADPVVAILRQQRRGLTNDELAAMLGVCKSAASQRVTRLVVDGTVSRQRVGREVQIKLIA